MNEFIIFGTQFNSREIAILIWFTLIFLWVLEQSNLRKGLWVVCKCLFNRQILLLLFATFFYTSLTVMLLYKLGIWQPNHIKSTIYWFIGSAIVLLVNTEKTTNEKFFYWKILFDNFKFIAILEYIVNFYTLHFFIEIIIVPILLFLVSLSTFAESDKKNKAVKNVVDFLLVAIGLLYIVYALNNLFFNYLISFTTKNLVNFTLPPILTFIFAPFLYIFVLFLNYEILFVRFKIFFRNDPKLLKFIKIKSFQLCHFNLVRLNYFINEYANITNHLGSKRDILKFTKNFKKEFKKRNSKQVL